MLEEYLKSKLSIQQLFFLLKCYQERDSKGYLSVDKFNYISNIISELHTTFNIERSSAMNILEKYTKDTLLSFMVENCPFDEWDLK